MNTLKAKLEAFQRSKVGQFVKKALDDGITDLAALLAWRTLSALLPLLLGILAIAGLVLRDDQHRAQIYSALLGLLPGNVSDVLGPALESIRTQAGAPVGIISLALLLYNGAGLFSNMASIFNRAYHVDNRNVVMNNLYAIVMLVIFTVLMIVSTVALGVGGLIGSLPVGLPFGPVLGRIVSWSLSIVTAIVTFLLLYKLLPNKPQSWRDALPGALLATIAFFVIGLVFPIYTKLFPPNHAYAVFGVFLVFTFYMYLLGIVFVLGAELNAFLEEPERSVAMAEATAQAQKGKAAVRQDTGQVEAEAVGAAPRQPGSPPLAAQQASVSDHQSRSAEPATSSSPDGHEWTDGASGRQSGDAVPERPGPVKSLLWTGLASGSLAVGGLLARRVSAVLWDRVMHEPPPTAKA